MDKVQIITTIIVAFVAVYGAILSTVNFILARRERKPRLKVTCDWGVITQGRDVSQPFLFINIANVGYKTITINAPIFRLENNTQIIFRQPQSEVNFPHELTEGKSCKLWEEAKPIASELTQKGHRGEVKLFAEVSDAVGNRYRAKKPFILKVDDLAK